LTCHRWLNIKIVKIVAINCDGLIFIFRAPGCFYDTDPEIKGIQKEKEDAEYFKKILDILGED
jgi:hypothetical protein